MAIRLILRPAGGEPTELTYDQQRVRIGRGAMCDLRLPHQAVSAVHAMIFIEGDRYFLVDPGSTNGTTLGDEVLVVERRKLLRSGDIFGVADFEIEFSSGMAITSHHSHERTEELARHLAQRIMADDGAELRNASLVVLTGPQTGQRFQLGPVGASLSVGRADGNDIVLDDGEVSRHHLSLDVSAEGVTLHDLGGKNALLLNDRSVTRQRLRDRDELLVGATRLVFDDPVEAYLRELAKLPDAEMSRPSHSDVEDFSAEDDTSGANSAPQDADDASADFLEEPSPAALPPKSPEDVASPVEGSVETESPRSSTRSVARGISRGFGASSGVEIAILLVGAVVLALCVGALVWIFR